FLEFFLFYLLTFITVAALDSNMNLINNTSKLDLNIDFLNNIPELNSNINFINKPEKLDINNPYSRGLIHQTLNTNNTKKLS
ncbi:MAG: hypothetical protein AABZ74_05010, partial [Cyanobacteriota bacterium]